MKTRRMLRINLLFWGLSFILWVAVIPVKAEQAEKTMVNQSVETEHQEDEIIRIEDITRLNDEFENLKEESVLIIEEVERYRKEERRKMIQRTVVIMLVMAIFGVGVLPGIYGKKKNIPVLTEESNTAEEETGGQN